jgi:hypothetical protein
MVLENSGRRTMSLHPNAYVMGYHDRAAGSTWHFEEQGSQQLAFSFIPSYVTKRYWRHTTFHRFFVALLNRDVIGGHTKKRRS